MGEAILIQRGSSSGEVIVEFDNFIPSDIGSLDEGLTYLVTTASSVRRIAVRARKFRVCM